MFHTHHKNKARCVVLELREIGITHLPYAVIKALINFITIWNNAVLASTGVSQEYSPREIVLRWQLDYK